MSPRPASPPGLASVAAEGDRTATLKALRDRLAREIERCESGRDVAALSRQLTYVLEQIDANPGEVEGSPLDDLAKRRAGRGASAPRKTRPARSG